MIAYSSSSKAFLENIRETSLAYINDTSQYSIMIDVVQKGSLEEIQQWIDLFIDDDLSWKDISAVLAWSTDKNAIAYFYDQLQTMLDTMPESADKQEFIDLIAKRMTLPIHHPEVLMDWMQTNGATNTDMFTPHWISMIAALVHNPAIAHELTLPHLHHLFGVSVRLEDPAQMRNLCRALDQRILRLNVEERKEVLRYMQHNMHKMNMSIWYTTHMLQTWSEKDISAFFMDVSTAHHRSMLNTKSCVCTAAQQAPSGPYDLTNSDKMLRVASYWLYPETTITRSTSNPKRLEHLRSTTALEELLFNPSPTDEQVLEGHWYKNNPEEAVEIWLDLAKMAQHRELQVHLLSNNYHDPKWRRLVFECHKNNSITPVAQWLCDQWLPGNTWVSVRQTADMLQELNDQWSPEEVWRMTILTHRSPKKEYTQELEHGIDFSIGDPI